VQLRIDLDQHSGETDGRVAAEWLSKTFFKERLYHEATSAQGHAAWATIALPPLNGRYLPKTTVHEHLTRLVKALNVLLPAHCFKLSNIEVQGNSTSIHTWVRRFISSIAQNRESYQPVSMMSM